MIRAFVLYDGDVDPQRYAEHLPIARAVPAAAFRHGRVFGAPFGEPAYFLIAEMYFPDRARFDEAMASPENRAAGKDLMGFAKGLFTLLIAE